MCCNSPRSSSPLTWMSTLFVPAPFSDIHHADLAPATDATRGAVSASPTCSMRSVAAPRLIMPPFAIPVEYEDPA